MELTICFTTEQVLADPIHCKGYQQFLVLGLVLETLVRQDSAGKIVGAAAESWEMSADETCYIFKLSEHSVFSNGRPMVASDVVFSMERHIQENSPSFLAAYLRNILQKVTALNSREICFKLKGAYPPFLEILATDGFGILGKLEMDACGEVIGSGPYKFVSSMDGLERNPHYEVPAPKVKSIRFVMERDAAKTMNLLLTGKVDVAVGAPLEVALNEELGAQFQCLPISKLVTTHVVLNNSDPYFHSRESRSAVAEILHELAYSSGLLSPFDEPLSTFLPKEVLPESYYQAAEKRFGKPGSGEAPKKPLRLVFPYGIFLEPSVRRIVDRFSEAGYVTSFINVKGKELIAPLQSGEFDLAFLPYQGLIPDPDGFLGVLEPNAIYEKAALPVKHLLETVTASRFESNNPSRLENYSAAFSEFEAENFLLPFAQNGIPIIVRREIHKATEARFVSLRNFTG